MSDEHSRSDRSELSFEDADRHDRLVYVGDLLLELQAISLGIGEYGVAGHISHALGEALIRRSMVATRLDRS